MALKRTTVGRIVAPMLFERLANLRLRDDAPPGTTATVSLPTDTPASVTEGGRPAAQSQGVRPAGMENGKPVYLVRSGHYAFSSKLAR